jgi:hypothetical protein
VPRSVDGRCPRCGEVYDECGGCDAMICSCDNHECDDFTRAELGADPEEEWDYDD